MNNTKFSFSGIVKKLNIERPIFGNEPILSQVHKIYETGLVFWQAISSVGYPIWTRKTKKRHSSTMMEEMGRNHFANNGSCLLLPLNMALVCTSCQSIGYSIDLYDDPLSWVMSLLWVFLKECIVHYRIMSLSCSIMLPSLFSCHPMFKGKLKKFTSAFKTVSVSVLLSQSYGYYIHIILELCSEFCVVNVGLIMALLRRDFFPSTSAHHLGNSLRNNI